MMISPSPTTSSTSAGFDTCRLPARASWSGDHRVRRGHLLAQSSRWSRTLRKGRHAGGGKRTMGLNLQITSRHFEPSEALNDAIRAEADDLLKLCDRIVRCRVIVDQPHLHR